MTNRLAGSVILVFLAVTPEVAVATSRLFSLIGLNALLQQSKKGRAAELFDMLARV